MTDKWRMRWGWVMVAAMVVVLAGVAIAGNSSQRVVVNRSGDEVGLAVAEPGNEDVVVWEGRGAWLGVRLSDVTPEKVSELKLKAEYGAIVSGVEPNSPAAKAGLQVNDVIVEYQGQRVESVMQLTRMVHETPPGRAVHLVVNRNGQRQTLSAKLEPGRGHGEIRVPRIGVPEIHIPPINVPDIEVFRTGPRLGIQAEALTPQLAEYFGVKQGKGVLVTEVLAGSPAATAGLKAGDVIVRLDDQLIENVSGLRRALRSKKPGETVALAVIRQRNEQTFKVQLEDTRRAESPTSGHSLDSEQLLERYRTSIEQLKQQLQILRENLQKQLAEKQRALQENLIRLQQEIRERIAL